MSFDGQQIALTRITDSTLISQDTTVWLMNSDGSDLRLFAQGPDGNDSNLKDPVWSPDGEWILVTLRPPNVAAPYLDKGHYALSSGLSNYTVANGVNTRQQVQIQTVCFDDAISYVAAASQGLDVDTVRSQYEAYCRDQVPQNASVVFAASWIR